MRITLVQPPSAYKDVHDLAPPLGLLTLAAVLESRADDVALVDFNLWGLSHPAQFENDFFGEALRQIEATRPDVVGFTSMALESHTCLNLAERLKRRYPDLTVVMGGPHFSSAAVRFMKDYPCVDFVVAGEGEVAFPELVNRLQHNRSMLGIKNVAYRAAGGVHLDRQIGAAMTRLELPFPAYHLINPQDYFNINPRRLADFEHARGCALRCSFCYSATQWGQGDRARSYDRVIEDMTRLRELGFRHLFFVGDNFLNSKESATELCREIEQANLDLTWDGYATLAQLTPPMVESLARSRCTSLFVGVDAVSNASKALFHKTYFKGWDKLATVLSNCLAHGITPTCSYLIDHPKELEAGTDHKDTDDALMTALLSQKLGCGVRLNSLAIYNDTELDQKALHQLRPTQLRAKYFFDTFDVNIRNELASKNPRLFPLHNTMLAPEEEERYVKVLFVAFQLFTRFPNTLYRYLVDGDHSAWRTFVAIAERVNDWDHTDKIRTKQQTVREFEALLMRDDTPTTVRDALHLEMTEQALVAGVERQKTVVNIVDSKLDYEVRCERRIELTTNPVLLESVEPLNDVKTKPEPYLVTLSDGEMTYYRVTQDVQLPDSSVSVEHKPLSVDTTTAGVDHAFSP